MADDLEHRIHEAQRAHDRAIHSGEPDAAAIYDAELVHLRRVLSGAETEQP